MSSYSKLSFNRGPAQQQCQRTPSHPSQSAHILLWSSLAEAAFCQLLVHSNVCRVFGSSKELMADERKIIAHSSQHLHKVIAEQS